MELRHLRYFTALAERLNFTHAARDVFVTQSTLSHQIKQLEDELATRLFERKGKQVTLTQDGEIFLASAQRALREIDMGIVNLRNSSAAITETIAIVATHTFHQTLIPACVSAFLKKNPSVRATIEERSAEDIEKGLLNDTIDIGITSAPSDSEQLWHEPLFHDELVLVVSEHHPFAARKRLRMAELHRQKLLQLTGYVRTRAVIDSCFRTAGAEPMVMAEFSSVTAMLDVIRHTDAAAIVSESALAGYQGVRAIRLESPKPMRTVCILLKRDKPQTPAARSFIGLLKESSNTIVKSYDASRKSALLP